MYCEQCMPEIIDEKWSFINGTYKVLTNVFTLEILQEIIAHAKEHYLTEIFVDTLTCETHGCEVCFLLHIRSQQERDEFLQSFEDERITFNEFF